MRKLCHGNVQQHDYFLWKHRVQVLMMKSELTDGKLDNNYKQN